MATTFTVAERTIGGGQIADPDTLQQQPAAYGFGVLPDLTLSLPQGTGSGQAQKWYLARRTLASTATDLLDLAGGLTDFQGNPITFSAVKRVLVAVVDPSAAKSVRVGPQGAANAWQGWWGGVTSPVYDTVFWKLDQINPYSGWTVTAGTGDILAVYNPSAGSVTYAVWIIGV